MQFNKAVRKAAKARIALAAPSGAGKTWTALLLAAGLGGRVGVIDSERGSASLYAGIAGMPEFDVLELSAPYTPEAYIEALAASAAAGHDVTILDGITPEWNGVGGCLELVDTIAAAKYRGNAWSAWNDITPRHRRFIDAMLNHPAHVIATMRSKTETAQEDAGNGRKKVVKLGMKSEQRDGIEYEFTAFLDLVHEGHYAMATKDRTGLFMGRDPAPLTMADGVLLREWLESGATVVDPAEKWLAAINRADSLDELVKVFGPAQAAMRALRNPDALAKVIEAKDRRKTALTPPPEPDDAGQPEPTTEGAAS